VCQSPLENIKKKWFMNALPMEIGKILLGRPWKFDKQTLHDDLSNKISFLHEGKKNHYLPSHTSTSEIGWKKKW